MMRLMGKPVFLICFLVILPLGFPSICFAGPNDITFFATTDSHIGASAQIDLYNEIHINIMNSLAGTSYPASIGGTVDEPMGIIVTGDLTQDGIQSQWEDFVGLYGLDGTDGLLNYPVYECAGNHDNVYGKHYFVRDGVIARHGSITYGWDWGPVHIVSLDIYPNHARREWLANHLANEVGAERAVIIFFHYNLAYTHSNYWTEEDKAAFKDTISGYNIVGILTGHEHVARHYVWEGYDVYGIGSPWAEWPEQAFQVFRITDTQMSVGVYYWGDENGGPFWRDELTHVKEITTSEATMVPLSNCNDVWQRGFGYQSDLNHDCRVDLQDLAKFAADWTTCNNPNESGCIENWDITAMTIRSSRIVKPLFILNPPFYLFFYNKFP